MNDSSDGPDASPSAPERAVGVNGREPASGRRHPPRKPIDSALAVSEERFRLLVESIADHAVLMLDPEGHVATWNRGAEAITGYAAEEILGHHVSRFYRGEDVERGRPEHELDAARRDGRFEGDGWRVGKDGDAIRANVVITPMYDDNGSLRGYAEVTRDVSERFRAEDELRQSHERLENRVRQRTTDLEQANVALEWEIEERKRAETALRESDERHRATLELMPAGVYVCEADGTIVYFNKHAETLWGQAPALGDSEQRYGGSMHLRWADGTPLPHGETPMAQVLDGTTAIRNQEVIIERPDGTSITALVNIDPIVTATGEILGAINVFQDISDRKRLFEQLLESEARFRHLIHALPAAIYTTDGEGRITLFNEHAVEVWGRRPELGKDMWCGSLRMYRPDGTALPHDQCPMAESLHEGRGVRGQEIIVERPDGSRVCVLPHPEPLRDAAGEMVGAVNMLVDITDRKRGEEALREQAEEVEKLMDVLPVAVWLARDADCRRITGNRAGHELLRLPLDANLSLSAHPSEQPGNFRIFHEGRELPLDELPLQYAARHGVDVQDFDEEIVFDDGSRVSVYGSASPLFDVDGNVRGCVAAFMDISEMRRLDEELRRKVEELAAADRLKDEFLATLAHELRNPLAPIRTGLELMRMAPDDTELIEEVRGSMERQTRQLVRLVDDLLDVSRITRGKLELRRDRVDLRDVVQSAIESARPLIEEHGHELVVALPEQPMLANADATRLAQVIANLLDNAAKYTSAAGTIWLTAARQGGELVVTVKDTGIGIPGDKLDAIFGLFSQGNESLEQGYSGLGIGLTLVKRLVEMHGGSVTVASDGVGAGSEFSVRLPIMVDAAVAEQGRSPAGTSARGSVPRRILVVDDNRDAAMALGCMLEILGNQVHYAYDGVEAVRAAEDHRPDVVLMDIGMPNLNGLDAARQIREQAWGADLMLIAQTGWGQDADKVRTRQAGFDHHLVKPIEPGELQTLLDGLARDVHLRTPPT